MSTPARVPNQGTTAEDPTIDESAKRVVEAYAAS